MNIKGFVNRIARFIALFCAAAHGKQLPLAAVGMADHILDQRAAGRGLALRAG